MLSYWYQKNISMDPRLVHPFTCIISGPTGSGKTQFVLKLLKNKLELITPPPQKIFWFYGEWQDVYRQPELKQVQFIEGLPKEDLFQPSNNNLIIIDDLLAETDARVTKLFTKGSHHRNCSVIFITQNLFDKNKEMRTINLNAHYMVLFKSPRDVSQIQHLAKQMYPRESDYMREAFADATSKPFSYLLVDLKPNTPEEMRLRANIFPGELQVVYIKR